MNVWIVTSEYFNECYILSVWDSLEKAYQEMERVKREDPDERDSLYVTEWKVNDPF